MKRSSAFLEIDRQDRPLLPVAERVRDFREFVQPLSVDVVRGQATRCMDCGVPFCHSGCPVQNHIPDWNALVSDDHWREALDRLHRTNNFPEFTGRICPAPCEAACTLNLEDSPVTIKSIECEIVDRGWLEGWITPKVAPRGTGKRIAIVGSGPAGLACAQQLARIGHSPTVFERNDRIGGLLRFGIPDFKMDKMLIDRRVAQMESEGVIFRTNMEIGSQVSIDRILDDYQAIVLANGAELPRDLPVPGRELSGVHFAMDYLVQANRAVAGLPMDGPPILANGRHVVVIGGGDTGSDCIGTAHRQGAASVTQLEILPRPPEAEDKGLVWPYWPMKLRTSSSQEEGANREFSVITRRLIGDQGRVVALECEREKERFELKADLVLLAMGFIGSPMAPVLEEKGIEMRSGKMYGTSQANIFSCGDMRRGQSLVVWAIREGRECAEAVDQYLAAH